MKKTILFLFLFISVFSFASAAVNEYNYFKYGELDSNNNLVMSSTSVSGVNVKGFICSTSDCSGTAGDLWGGAFYTSGTGVNLVYPTTLQSSGYGFWVYKTGYVPYWVKGVTWYGTGTVPSVNRYLSKKQNCVADVSISDFSQNDDDLSFNVNVGSPIANNYGSIYLPAEISPYLKTLVSVNAEIRDGAGQLIWSSNGNKDVDYSGSGEVSFSASNLNDGVYTLSVYSSLGSEAKCLAYSQDSASFSFSVDTVPSIPTFSIQESSAYLGSSVSFIYTSSGSTYHQADTMIDGGSWTGWVDLPTASCPSYTSSGCTAIVPSNNPTGNYTYKVRGCNSDGVCGGESDVDSIIFLDVPQLPTEVLFDIVEDSVYEYENFTWTYGATDADYYELNWRVPGGSWQPDSNWSLFDTDEYPINVYHSSVASAEPNTYYFVIRACNDAGCVTSDQETIEVLALPTALSFNIIPIRITEGETFNFDYNAPTSNHVEVHWCKWAGSCSWSDWIMLPAGTTTSGVSTLFADFDSTVGTYIFDMRPCGGASQGVGCNDAVIREDQIVVEAASSVDCTDSDSDGSYVEGGSCGSLDCDDNDASVWQILSGYTDADSDGYSGGSIEDVCSGSSLPSGYDAFTDGDCDDDDVGIWRILFGFYDGDFDSFGAGAEVVVCSGVGLPVGYVSNNNDCDDNDASVWQILSGYTDADFDEYGFGSEIGVCSGSDLFGDYVLNDDDCDDGDYHVNPGMTEICDDGVDNDCDGLIDEGCTSALLVSSVIADPVYGVVPLEVSFSCVGSGGIGALEYFWDLGNGDLRTGSEFIYTYDETGEFDVECGVRDDNGDEAFGYVEVEVVPGSLDIVELICFDSVIVGHNQSCSVSVEDGFGNKVGGIDVEIFYSDGSSFGECVSDSISGACGVKDLQGVVGDFEVYVVASGSNFVSDDDEESTFSYEVIEEEYNIVELKVFNDSDFLYEDYDFFRGENLFASFSVEEINGSIVYENLISEVSLVSSLAGGHVDLEFVDFENGVYYYKLIPVPITHDFLGESNVFAFVFDLVSGNGGQEEVSMTIRNNLPFVSPVIPGQSVVNGRTVNVDLEDFENDVEDSGDALVWEVVSFGDGVDVVLTRKNLAIEGLSEGDFEVVLRLVDLDLDYVEVSFNVDVSQKKSSSSGSSSCYSDWECSAWSECDNNIMFRDCTDSNECSRQTNIPMESQSCSTITSSADNPSVLDLSGSSVVKNKVVGKFEFEDYIYWVIGILAVSILLILVLIFLIL